MTHPANTPAGEPDTGTIPHSYDPELTPDEPVTSHVTTDVTSGVDYASSDATVDASSFSTGQELSTDVSTADGESSGSTADVARDQAAQVKDTAVEAGKNVAGTTKEEAASVVAEAQEQAKSLLHTVSSEVKDQAGTQQQRVAGALHSLAKELGSMASSSSESGPLTDLAHQAAHKGGEIAHWLESREPSDVLEEVKRFARRRPVTFLLLCGAAGVLAGRITRGAVAAKTELDSPTGTPAHATPTPALTDHPFEPETPVIHPETAVAPTVVAPTMYDSTPESPVYAPAAGQTGTDHPGVSR